MLHIGHNNAYCDYSMNGEILQSVTEETDLGIIVSDRRFSAIVFYLPLRKF